MTEMPSGRYPVEIANTNMQVQCDFKMDTNTVKNHYADKGIANSSPDPQINIFSGGWDDDADEEADYVDMAPIQSKPSPFRTNSPRENSDLPAEVPLSSLSRPGCQTPDVVVQPASPYGSIASTSSLRGTSRSPSPVPSTDDSDSEASNSEDSDENSDNESKNNKILVEDQKQRSTSQTNSPKESCSSSPSRTPKRTPTIAGQAARKYLQMQQMNRSNSRMSEVKSSGLSRSSSRVGSGGVQSRISKNRQPQSPLSRGRSLSEQNLDGNEGENESKQIPTVKIDEAKRKSRTLDRALNGAKATITSSHSQSHLDDQEFALERKPSDGASVIKMITDRRSKSQSLDSKYLEYLEGISKHASSPNLNEKCNAVEDSQMSSKSPSKDKAKKKSKKPSKEELDDEAEYRKYAETMAGKSRSSRSGGSSTLSLEANTVGQNLLDFANERSKEKTKSDKQAKKMSQKMSFRKSKTLGRVSKKQEMSFAMAAQAFHEQLVQSDQTKSNISEPTDKEKSNSLKREKRKSWKKLHKLSVRSRSKEKMVLQDSEDTIMSPPTTLADYFNDVDLDRERNPKSPPIIKQSLGYKSSESPNLRLHRSNERSSSIRSDRSPDRSPKIMSPAASVRSMTLDNRKKHHGHHRQGSSGQLVTTHSLLRNTHSLNSENSGSNSDISNILDDEYEEFRAKHGNKAGTLSRLLGRKAKERALDGSNDGDTIRYPHELYGTGSLGRRKKHGKYATLGSPSQTLRSLPFHSIEVLSTPSDERDLFFKSKYFVHGFRMEIEDNESDDESSDEQDIAIQLEIAKQTNNKYATITGRRTASTLSYESGSLKKRKAEAIAEAAQCDESPTTRRRNKSLPVTTTKPTKGKSFGSVISRTLIRGYSTGPASNHLAFSDALTEDEIVENLSDRLTESPLRTRKFQIVEPLHEQPSPKILSAARLLYRHLVATRPDLLQTHNSEDERDSNGPFSTTHNGTTLTPSYENSIFGNDLVTWLVTQFSENASTTSSEARNNACGMLQALLEEGAISHVRKEHHFQDTYLLYQFHESATRPGDGKLNGRPVSSESSVSSSTTISGSTTTTNDSTSQNGESTQTSRNGSVRSTDSERWVPSIVDEQQLKEVLSCLQNVAPDAMFRMVLRKFPEDRTAEELMMIYEEILHIKALTHLSDSVKRELAGVLKFEFHRKSGKTLFSQGDEGRSWYIIVKGAVDVDIQGQGVVCTLHEGDDFGNLAIINDAPRAATIVLAEDNCQLLRVDKHDFVRILKDVEANTVRLKEHDKDVLILQKIHARSSSQNGREKYINNNTKVNQRIPVAATPTRHIHRYAISAGTPAKIVEHVIKSLRPWSTARQSDEAMEDLILMYQVFMSTEELCKQLMNIYQSETTEQIDATKSIKRKVVYFVVRWSHIATHIFYDQPASGSFLKELKQAVTDDVKIYPNLKEDLARIYVPEASPSESPTHRGWITVDSATIQRYPVADSPHKPHQAVRAGDDVMLKVYNSNRTYTTVRLPAISTVNEIISSVAEKQGREPENLLLIQVQSDGDMYVLPRNMKSAATSVGVNSRLFICTSDEKDDIEPLEEQNSQTPTNSTVLELVGSLEIAEHITQFDWELINSIHVMEFVHKVFGSHKFHSVTSNIDLFARRFNQLAYWAPTEICACNNLNKRVHLLRKFIKIAQHLKELQNMNAFMAVMIGLGNQALSRLHGTWDKLPTKYKKLMTEFEAVLDPSRNHRAYRLHVAGLRPPLIPYLPLLMKDMTFQHEGNDSTRNGLINFEKMHMMSNSIRAVIQACCKPFEISHSLISSKNHDETRQYTRNFIVITNQKHLNELSGKIEGKR